jgi:hypothetical protein
MAEIKDFWVVTKPSKTNTLEDILFKANLAYMRNQFVGGLKAADILGAFTVKKEAEDVAKAALKARK